VDRTVYILHNIIDLYYNICTMAIRTSFGTNLDFPNNILHYDLLATLYYDIIESN